MTDNLTKKQRSRVMASIRGKNTLPELRARDIFTPLRLVYQPKGVYGRPDFADRKRKVAIFVDGCFWHGCKAHFKEPTSNTKFWRQKIFRNRLRDKEVTERLRKEGWIVIRLWEHEIKARAGYTRAVPGNNQ